MTTLRIDADQLIEIVNAIMDSREGRVVGSNGANGTHKRGEARTDTQKTMPYNSLSEAPKLARNCFLDVVEFLDGQEEWKGKFSDILPYTQFTGACQLSNKIRRLSNLWYLAGYEVEFGLKYGRDVRFRRVK